MNKKCQGAESNCGHPDFQSGALPTELPWLNDSFYIKSPLCQDNYGRKPYSFY